MNYIFGIFFISFIIRIRYNIFRASKEGNISMSTQTQKNTQAEATSEKILTRDFILICVANFFFFLGFQMTLPTLPLFVKELGGSDQLIGLIVGVFTFSALVLRPYAGKALDTKGRRFVYMFGIGIFILSIGTYAFVTSIVLLLLLRVVQGAGWGFSTTASGTIATDLIPPSRRGEGMGYYGMSGNVAMAIGPALGLTLVDKISFASLFLICAACGLTTLLLSSKIRYKKVEASPHQSTNIKFDFFEKTAIQPSILLMFITACFGGIASFLPLYAAEKSIDGIEFYFLVYAVSVLLARTFSGKLYDRKGHLYVFPPGAFLILLAMILLTWLPNTWMMLLAAMIYGIGFGSVQPALQAWAVSKAAMHRKGMANATFFSAFDLGIGIGAMTFGQLAYWFGYQSIYFASSISIFISILFYFYFYYRAKQEINRRVL